MTIPEGFTDDLTVPLPRGVTVAHLVDAVITATLEFRPEPDSLSALKALGISSEDVDFVVDRVAGGLVRGATMNPANEPSSAKDPIAWESYHRYVKSKAP